MKFKSVIDHEADPINCNRNEKSILKCRNKSCLFYFMYFNIFKKFKII